MLCITVYYFCYASFVFLSTRKSLCMKITHTTCIKHIVCLRVRCLRQRKCRSINYDPGLGVPGLGVCELNTASYLSAPGNMVDKPNASHYDVAEWNSVRDYIQLEVKNYVPILIDIANRASNINSCFAHAQC